MNRLVVLGVLNSFLCAQVLSQDSVPNSQSVVHVSTAVNHLTVLEFHEPVTMVAAGSSDFQIERMADKVFIKPTKSGVATDLFVWTASRRLSYELETTPEVKNMNFAIDSAQPDAVPRPVADLEANQIADVVLTRALLGAEQIASSGKRPVKNQVSVHVEQVFRSRSTVYIQYTIENHSQRAYRVKTPEAYQLQTDQADISLPLLAHTQLDRSTLDKLRGAKEVALSVAHAEVGASNLGPGQTTPGVVCIREDLPSPIVLELVFEDGIKAVVVL